MARYYVVNNCESTSGWTLDTNGVGTGSIDSSIFAVGTGSIKYVRTVSKSRGFSCTLRYTFSARNFTERILTFKYRWDTPQNQIKARFINGTGNQLAPANVSLNVAPNVWHTARIPMMGAKLDNTVSFDVYNDGDSYTDWADGQVVTLWIDDIKLEGPERRPVRQPVTVIELDDSYLDQYTEAFPLFEAYNGKGTFAVITGFLGGVYPSTSVPIFDETQLMEIYNAGHEIASHTRNHVNMTGPKETVISEMKGSMEDLLGFGVDIKHLVYPFTQHNTQSEEISQLYYQSASNGQPPRQNQRDKDTFTMYGAANRTGKTWRYTLMRQACGPTTTVQDVIDWLEDSLRYTSLLIINLHEVNATFSGPSGAQWSPERLEALLKYMQAKGIALVTTTQALRLFGF